MHEFGIAVEILRICEETLRPEGRDETEPVSRRLETVRVVVGELSAVEPDLLRFAWEAAVEETAFRGSALQIEWRRARQFCEPCGERVERQTGGWHRRCPVCGSALRVDGGDELDVLDLTVAESREEVSQ